MHFNMDNEAQNPDSILLWQFISKKHKTVYYTYDFGVDHTFKIEYAGLTEIPEWIRRWLCTKYQWFNLIEDITIEEQIEYMKIYQDKDKKKLQETIDRLESWEALRIYENFRLMR